MIEIVFGDGALGSLKQAQSYGIGKFNLGFTEEIFISDDYREDTKKEILAAKKIHEENEQLNWLRGKPMGGSPSDIYGFNYMLSIGDISEDLPGEKRRRTLDWLYSIFPGFDEYPSISSQTLQQGSSSLAEVCKRISSGESIRIWYSNNPDELCGMYWLMSRISQLELKRDQVYIVQQPGWKMDGMAGWDSVSPGDWHSYTELEHAVSKSFILYCSRQWHQLQQENGTLRGTLNGHLVSLPENIYDEFILREIETLAEEFHEAKLIGRILGKYDLGIRDAWIAHRIEDMVHSGRLIAITEHDPGDPSYHRILRKL